MKRYEVADCQLLQTIYEKARGTVMLKQSHRHFKNTKTYTLNVTYP